MFIYQCMKVTDPFFKIKKVAITLLVIFGMFEPPKKMVCAHYEGMQHHSFSLLID